MMNMGMMRLKGLTKLGRLSVPKLGKSGGMKTMMGKLGGFRKQGFFKPRGMSMKMR